MLADPAQTGIARQRLFQNGCTVRKRAVAEWPNGCGYSIAELLQARTHEFVVVAPQGIAGHVRHAPVGEYFGRVGGVGRPVIHARADATDGARHEFGRARPFGAVARHVLHLAVEAGEQPVAKVCLVGGQIDRRDAEAREA